VSEEKGDLPKGFTCGCGKEHLYPAYVYAHWDDLLNFKCSTCDAKYAILRGKVTRKRYFKKVTPSVE